MILSVGHQASIRQAELWTQLYGLTYPVLADEGTTVVPLFLPNYGGIFILPHSCIVDDNQILQYTHQGYEYPATIEEIEETILDLFQPELSPSVDAIDFNDVPVGSSAVFELYLDNSRTGILNITSASVAGEPFAVDFTPGEVYAVDDSMLVSVTFSPLEEGEFEDVLVITSNGGDIQIPVSGNGVVGVFNPDDKTPPTEFTLFGNYPNPFNAETTIEFALPKASPVLIQLFSVSGELVDSYHLGNLVQGNHKFRISGEGYTSGLYFYRLTAGEHIAVDKMILLK